MPSVLPPSPVSLSRPQAVGSSSQRRNVDGGANTVVHPKGSTEPVQHPSGTGVSRQSDVWDVLRNALCAICSAGGSAARYVRASPVKTGAALLLAQAGLGQTLSTGTDDRLQRCMDNVDNAFPLFNGQFPITDPAQIKELQSFFNQTYSSFLDFDPARSEDKLKEGQCTSPFGDCDSYAEERTPALKTVYSNICADLDRVGLANQKFPRKISDDAYMAQWGSFTPDVYKSTICLLEDMGRSACVDLKVPIDLDVQFLLLIILKEYINMFAKNGDRPPANTSGAPSTTFPPTTFLPTTPAKPQGLATTSIISGMSTTTPTPLADAQREWGAAMLIAYLVLHTITQVGLLLKPVQGAVGANDVEDPSLDKRIDQLNPDTPRLFWGQVHRNMVVSELINLLGLAGAVACMGITKDVQPSLLVLAAISGMRFVQDVVFTGGNPLARGVREGNYAAVDAIVKKVLERFESSGVQVPSSGGVGTSFQWRSLRAALPYLGAIALPIVSQNITLSDFSSEDEGQKNAVYAQIRNVATVLLTEFVSSNIFKLPNLKSRIQQEMMAHMGNQYEQRNATDDIRTVFDELEPLLNELTTIASRNGGGIGRDEAREGQRGPGHGVNEPLLNKMLKTRLALVRISLIQKEISFLETRGEASTQLLIKGIKQNLSKLHGLLGELNLSRVSQDDYQTLTNMVKQLGNIKKNIAAISTKNYTEDIPTIVNELNKRALCAFGINTVRVARYGASVIAGGYLFAAGDGHTQGRVGALAAGLGVGWAVSSAYKRVIQPRSIVDSNMDIIKGLEDSYKKSRSGNVLGTIFPPKELHWLLLNVVMNLAPMALAGYVYHEMGEFLDSYMSPGKNDTSPSTTTPPPGIGGKTPPPALFSNRTEFDSPVHADNGGMWAWLIISGMVQALGNIVEQNYNNLSKMKAPACSQGLTEDEACSQASHDISISIRPQPGSPPQSISSESWHGISMTRPSYAGIQTEFPRRHSI